MISQRSQAEALHNSVGYDMSRIYAIQTTMTRHLFFPPCLDSVMYPFDTLKVRLWLRLASVQASTGHLFFNGFFTLRGLPFGIRPFLHFYGRLGRFSF